jgi:nucleoside-diphosphate-sugar epimerase
MATKQVITWAVAHGAKRFIFTSSLSVHGSIQTNTVDETTGTVNPDVYGMTKRLAESLLEDARDALPSIALRLPGVVGLNADRIWLSNLARKLASNEPVRYYNPDAAFNNILYATDLASFIADLAETDVEGATAFPLGTASPVPISEVVETMTHELRSKSEITVVAPAKESFTISNQVAESFGYAPIPTMSALKKYLADLQSLPQPKMTTNH